MLKLSRNPEEEEKNDKFRCILTQFLMDRKHGQSFGTRILLRFNCETKLTKTVHKLSNGQTKGGGRTIAPLNTPLRPPTRFADPNSNSKVGTILNSLVPLLWTPYFCHDSPTAVHQHNVTSPIVSTFILLTQRPT